MSNLLRSPKALKLRPYFPVFGLILLNLLLMPLFINDYGETWDDNSLYLYGEDTIDAYRRGLTGQELSNENLGPFNLRYYGPVYYATAEIANQPLDFLFNWDIVGRWHAVNFLVFQLALFFLYLLCRRIMSAPAAFVSVLLFMTQPLIWGHAVINPKDIPFLTFFLGTIVTGLAMVDSFVNNSPYQKPNNTRGTENNETTDLKTVLQRDWEALPPRTKWGLVLLAGLLLVGVATLYLAEEPILDLLEKLTRTAYASEPTELLGKIFERIAPNPTQTGVESYLQKSVSAFIRFRLFTLVLSPIALMAASAIAFRNSRAHIIGKYLRPLIIWIKAYVPWNTLLAGLVLGVCSAIRILGPAAGGLVMIYFVWQAGRRSIPALFVYALTAGVVMYWGWPYLWEAPISRFWEVLQLMSDFPGVGSVLFDGQFISPMDLPWHYLITLMSLQLSLPLITLFVVGLVVTGMKLTRGTIDRPFVLILFSWFILPVLVFTLSPPRLYDNFRQLLFLLPPVFAFSGLAIDVILKKISSTKIRWAAVGSLVLPGVVWVILLHPYQYIFYNALAGGVGNAYTRYEMDYWVTSFQETAEYLNEHAPQDSQIIVYGPEHIVKRAAREDLVFAQDILNQGEEPAPDYAVLTTRYNWHLENYPDAPIVFEVGRFGAVFSVVKYVGDGN